jgi:hypothetical protein
MLFMRDKLARTFKQAVVLYLLRNIHQFREQTHENHEIHQGSQDYNHEYGYETRMLGIFPWRLFGICDGNAPGCFSP